MSLIQEKEGHFQGLTRKLRVSDVGRILEIGKFRSEYSATQLVTSKSAVCVGMDSEKLLWAVKNGDLQSIKENLKNMFNVNSTFKNGRTLIHYAADYGQEEICGYLIHNGADININDNFGVTPLLAAIYEGHIDCVSLLLKNGAKLGHAPDGSTYVDCATSENIRNILRNYVTV